MISLENFVMNIALGREGFSTKLATGNVVSIIRDRIFERSYVTLKETKQLDYKIVCDENIMKFRNLSFKRVFMRAGTLFEGPGRVLLCENSFICQPDQDSFIDTRWLGKDTKVSKTFVLPVGLSEASLLYLIESQEKMFAIRQQAFDYIYKTAKGGGESKYVPMLNNQIGIALFDDRGINYLEVFDFPISWAAYHHEIIHSLTKQINLKTSDGTEPWSVQTFLQEVLECEIRQLYGSIYSGAFRISNSKVCGEFSMIDKRIIHLIVIRRN
jgi:hypothetical protein